MAEVGLIPTTSGALATPRGRETNPAAVYLASLAPTGRYSMMRALDRIAAVMGHTWQTMPWAELRYEHIQAIRTKLSERHKPATLNTALCGLRRVVHEAWRLAQIDAETYARIKDVPRSPARRCPRSARRRRRPGATFARAPGPHPLRAGGRPPRRGGGPRPPRPRYDLRPRPTPRRAPTSPSWPRAPDDVAPCDRGAPASASSGRGGPLVSRVGVPAPTPSTA